MAIWGLYGPQWQHYADSFAVWLPAARQPGRLPASSVGFVHRRCLTGSSLLNPTRLRAWLQNPPLAVAAAAAAAEGEDEAVAEPPAKKRLQSFSSFPPSVFSYFLWFVRSLGPPGFILRIISRTERLAQSALAQMITKKHTLHAEESLAFLSPLLSFSIADFPAIASARQGVLLADPRNIHR